ncbi:Uncharacterised protein [Enterococcus casseliflavus]|uniref:hypothetical protein n=1 Tax=Enterococcus casseliflavus TaxID=37734 RepID=UPI000E0559BE|nr:hypothetical protein [Enterococcus casseliflavus]GEB30155.1 hypothetical protein ECA02_32500 [Enterococcus casseliflavus]STP33066.1 Uncharacterised protein [Enterococcus casseliflavus]
MKIRVRNTIKLDIEGKVKTYGPSRTVYKIDDKVAKEKNYSKRFKKYPEHIEIVEDIVEEVVVVDMTPPPDQEEEKEQETVEEDSPADKPKKKKAAPKKKKKDEE